MFPEEDITSVRADIFVDDLHGAAEKALRALLDGGDITEEYAETIRVDIYSDEFMDCGREFFIRLQHELLKTLGERSYFRLETRPRILSDSAIFTVMGYEQPPHAPRRIAQGTWPAPLP